MSAPIVLTGLAASDPVPGVYLEVAFAQGQASSGTAVYPILVLGNKTSAGSAVVDTGLYGPDTATPMANLNDAAALCGLRSEAYRMLKRVFAVNNTSPVYVACPTASGGTAASLAMTIANAATGNGIHRTYFADEFVDTTITSGDTAIQIATNIVTSIATKTDWPFTAANSGTAVVTLTAAIAGPRGNNLRVGSQIISPSSIATTSSVPSTGSNFTLGATLDSWTAAIAAIASKFFYYIISADDGGQSSTNLTALNTQVATQAQPITGIRQVVIAGANDTSVSNVTTIAIAQNTARCQIYYQNLSDFPPSELAASLGAAEAYYESSLSAGKLNFDGFGTAKDSQKSLMRIPAPRAGVQLTRTQIASCLNNGVSPIASTTGGATYLVSRITTKCQTSSVADYRIRDAHKVRICDRFADDLKAKVTLQFGGKAIGDDPLQGQRPPGPDVVTPRIFKRAVAQLCKEYWENDLLQSADAGIIAQRETSPTTRMSAYVPLQTADVMHQAAMYLAQVA